MALRPPVVYGRTKNVYRTLLREVGPGALSARMSSGTARNSVRITGFPRTFGVIAEQGITWDGKFASSVNSAKRKPDISAPDARPKLPTLSWGATDISQRCAGASRNHGLQPATCRPSPFTKRRRISLGLRTRGGRGGARRSPLGAPFLGFPSLSVVARRKIGVSARLAKLFGLWRLT